MKETNCRICGNKMYYPEGTEKTICSICRRKSSTTKTDRSPLAQRLKQYGKKQVCQSIIDQINEKATS